MALALWDRPAIPYLFNNIKSRPCGVPIGVGKREVARVKMMKKVLLISSEIIRGSVGATAAQFALQRLGLEVWSLPSIVLSNHHGHAHFAGARMKPAQLRPMLEALEFNDWLEEVDAVFTGFLPMPEHVAFAAEAVDLVRAAQPEALYLCDPAIGDDPKGLYVDRAAAETLRLELLPRADVLTPNRFELEWLTAKPVRNATEAIEAIRALQAAHPNGPKTIFATSVPKGQSKLLNMLSSPDGVWRTECDRLDDVPHGTGDLFAAFCLAELLGGAQAPQALGQATAAISILVQEGQGQEELPLVATQSKWSNGKAYSVKPEMVPA